MKYFMIAGERSGDMYGSQLIKAIRRTDRSAEVVVYGGDQMEKAGARLIHHYRDLAVMGFWEVLLQLVAIRGVLHSCRESLLNFHPDVLILIDFPGFNLRMARFAAKYNLKVVYYISPKLWAWRTSRISSIRSYVDKMLVIFPFEVEFYERLGYPVQYVGNPLVRHIEEAQPAKIDLPPGFDYTVAFFPGSRIQEVNRSMLLLQQLANRRKRILFLVAGVSNIGPETYEDLQPIENIMVQMDSNYSILSQTDAAVITSGTATLECALFEVPQVVGYKTSRLSYEIGKRVVKVPYISLVNILAAKEVVRELIQGDFTLANLEAELVKLLTDEDYRRTMINNYQGIRKQLGDQNAAEVAANEIVTWLSRN